MRWNNTANICSVCENDFRNADFRLGDLRFCSTKCAGHYFRRQRVTGDDAYEESEKGYTWRGEFFETEEELEEYMGEELEDTLEYEPYIEYDPEEEFFDAVDYYWGR